MTLNPDRQTQALAQMKARNGYGVGDETLKLSRTESLEKEDKEKLNYSRQLNSEEVLEYISNMPEFDLSDDFDPGSSSEEELEARCKDMNYRLRWLEALLMITREELKVFNGALEKLKNPVADEEASS
jgi:hypothetical protein